MYDRDSHLRSLTITGGLGTATGKLLQSHGAKLALLYAPFEASRKQSVLQENYGESRSEDVSSHQCDITSEASVKQAFEEISATSASSAFPSILVNAAGYVTVQPMEELSSDEAAKNILANIMGPFNVSKAFYHLYQSKLAQSNTGVKVPPGRIVSLSSQAAHVALDGHSAYCASKAGLNGLTRCMANEWARKGITANTVSPTVVLTALGKMAWADTEKRNKHLNEIPTGRFSEPDEIAAAIEFLCRDDSGMINGADLRVDGGFTIR